MSVQTIFKTIIGTIAIMVLYSCCVELFNVNISGMQIKQTCNMAANQSAELVTQETYREAKASDGVYSRSTKMTDLKAPDGTVYVTGDFYNGKTTTPEIWNMMYAGSSSNFKRVCNLTKEKSVTITTKDGDKVTYSLEEDKDIDYDYTYFANGKTIASIYRELDELYGGLYKSSEASKLSTIKMDWNEFLSANNEDTINKKSAGANALRMRNDMFTPVNIGFPYFDPEVTNRMFRWDLAMILSNGDKDSIQTEKQSNGTKRYFINYKGFRCYANEAQITNFKYYIINTSTNSGKNKLDKMIDLDTDKLNKIVHTGKNNHKYTNTKENNYIAVVGIEYTIPIAYEGITPIAKIFKYVWNKEVEGMDNNDVYNHSTDTTGKTGTGDWDFAAGNMTNSSKSNNGMMPSTGELYYVLTR